MHFVRFAAFPNYKFGYTKMQLDSGNMASAQFEQLADIVREVEISPLTHGAE